jgi:magnesium chelatase family protein
VNDIEAYPVEVEVNAGYGDTIIVIIGLPDAAVKEARERVITALANSGFNFAFRRTTINLAPADVKKEGPSLELPVGLGMVAASEWIQTTLVGNHLAVGELAMDGTARPAEGVLPIALGTRADGEDEAMRACACDQSPFWLA